ncbi:MAG: DUF6259 domain-containing protein, partial [Candidatus Hydrogenedentota bacterium]
LILKLASIKLIPRAAEEKIDGDEFAIHAVGEGYGSLYRFAGNWDDGTPTGAEANSNGTDLVIEGRNEKDMFGAVLVNATVDLDRFGGLIADVKELSRAGYVILQHTDLPGGFIRAQPEITKPGLYNFDLRRLLGKSGLVTFKILLGVSTQGAAPSVKGERMVLSRVAFGASPLRAVDKIRISSPLVPVSAPPIPSGSLWPDPTQLRPLNSALAGMETLKPVAALVSAKGDRITVRGGMTELVLSATIPTVIDIRDLSSARSVSSGGALFAVETVEGGLVDAEADVRAGKAKCDVTIEPGSVKYHVAFDGYAIDLAVTPREGGVALSAEVASTSQRVLGVMLPGKFLYPIAPLKEVVIPRWLGIGLKPAFFEDERTASFNYPAGFSDFVHAASQNGNLALMGGGLAGTERRGNLMKYRGEGIVDGEWTGLRPATISVGGSPLGSGFVTRMIPARIDPGQSLSTGDVLIAAGLPLSSAAALYRRQIFQDDVKPLAARMGEKLFQQYSRAALVKLDFGGYPGVDRILDDVALLPEGVLLHPVTYWTGGFDRNYPDFFPADPKFSGNNGLKRLTGLAHSRKMLVAPYVNPTWWNVSATANRVGLEKIAIRDEEDKPIEDVYGENKGWMVTPWSDEVRAVRRQLHETVYTDLGMDGVFEDQIGARDWKDDYSRNAPAPYSYSEGMVRWAAENPRGGILMTENGFDAIAPFEHSLCGMWPVGTWPDPADLDARYGGGNWRVVPVSSMIAHDLADFLHHNLAVEARTDADAKLAWNVAYGFHLYEILHANLPRQHARWIDICQVFQEEVNSLSTGRRLTEWAQMPDGAVWTQYEGGLSAYALLGRSPIAFAGSVIPAPGVIAGSREMTAGIFSALAGFDFGTPRALIMKRLKEEGNAIIVTIPDDRRGLLAIPRSASARNNSGLAVESLEGGSNRPVEYALTDRAIVFLHRPGADGIGRYRIAAVTSGASAEEWHAQLRAPNRVTAGTVARVKLEIHSGGNPMAIAATGLAAWTVNRTGPVPARDADVKTSATSLKLSSNSWGGSEFEVIVPEDVTPGEYLWITAKVMTDRGEKTVTTLAPIDPGLIVAASADTVVRMATEVPIQATLMNRTTHDVTGRLELLIDRATVTTPYTSSDITIRSGGTWTGMMPAAALSRGPHRVILRFQTTDGIVVTGTPVDINAVEPLQRADLEGRNLIPAEGMAVRFLLAAPSGRGYRGTAVFTGEGGWKVSPPSLAVNVPPGGEVSLPVRIVPGDARLGKITVRISGPDGEISHVEKYQKLDGQPVILMDDLNGDGLNEIAFGHETFEAQCAIAAGGRILLLAGSDGVNHLHSKYPPREKPADPRAWIELGGINDWWPRGWPGDVWNNEWKLETRSDPSGVHVVLSSLSREGLTIRRAMTIGPSSNVLVCDYEIANPTSSPVTQLWAAHPDLAVGPGGAGKEDRIVVPTERGLRQHDYRPRLAKVSFFRPTGGWAAAQDRTSGHFVALLYQQGGLTEIGIWEGIGFFTMEPIRGQKTLQAGEKDTFRIGYGVGRGDPGVLAPEMAKRLEGQ